MNKKIIAFALVAVLLLVTASLSAAPRGNGYAAGVRPNGFAAQQNAADFAAPGRMVQMQQRLQNEDCPLGEECPRLTSEDTQVAGTMNQIRQRLQNEDCPLGEECPYLESGEAQFAARRQAMMQNVRANGRKGFSGAANTRSFGRGRAR